MDTPKLRSGIFLAGFHPADEDPTLAARQMIRKHADEEKEKEAKRASQ